VRRAALTALVALIATGAPSPAAVTGAPPPRAASLLVMVRPGAQPPAVPGAGPARLVSRALGAWELTLPSRTGSITCLRMTTTQGRCT